MARTLGVMILVVLAVLTVIFYFEKNVLQNNYSILQSEGRGYESIVLTSHGATLEASIVALNEDMAKVQQIQKGFITWSKFFQYLSDRRQNTIQITSIVLDQADSSFLLEGRAKTRSDILSFQDFLNASPLFDDVSAPISNLTERENVDFSFSGKLNLATLASLP